MSTKKPKDMKAYANINLDELLSKLTTEQLEDLHTELIDPDDSMVPPSDRCRYRTDKLPAGPFNRKKLLDFLEKKAREEKDWDEEKPFTKEKRGKIWSREKEEKIKLHDDDSTSTEWDDILNKASEAELVDLAAILGFHGMLNQVQYHQAFVEGKKVDDGSGFQSVARYTDFKHFEADKANDTDVEKCLEQMKEDDEELKEFNINNIRKLKIEKLCEIAKALEKNTHLTKLSMANTRATDKVVKVLANSLKINKTLKELNLESNYISGSALILLFEAMNVHQSVTDLKISNQRPQTLGVQYEMQITRLIKFNQNLLRVNIVMETWSAKILLTRYLQRNVDNLRRKRMGQEIILSTEDERPYYLKDKTKIDTPENTAEASSVNPGAMSDTGRSLVFVVGILAVIHSASGLQCYQCDSNEDDSCPTYKPFDRNINALVDCQSFETRTPGTFCLKITRQSPGWFGWMKQTRRCGSRSDTGVAWGCRWTYEDNGVWREMCYCDDADGCNYASRIKCSQLLIILPLLWTFMISIKSIYA